MKTTFGFVGTFGAWHGAELFADIVPAVVGQNADVHFLLIGEGPGRALLQAELESKGIKEHVAFAGKILPHKIPSYLAECDAFLCPTQPNADGTQFFGSPTKLFEYLSMGRPVIASNIDQVRDIVSPSFTIDELKNHALVLPSNQVGILIDPHDVQGFVEACLYLASLPSAYRQKMGENARKKAVEQYTWRAHVQKIIEHSNL